MHSNPLIDLIGQLDVLDVDEGAREAFRKLALAVGAQHGIRGIDRIEQLAYVRSLLDLRVSRPTVRDRLTALYPISRRQAYRLIDEALHLRQKSVGGIGADPEANIHQ